MPKGHLQNTANNNNNTVDPFGSNVAASQAYKAMERLVTATYMVTNLAPETELLRIRIRDNINELLEDTLRLRKGFTSLGAGAVGDIVAKVRLILSLLDTLYTAGMISKMNLSVLKEAFTAFTASLDSMSTASSADGVELTKEYFEAIQTVATDYNKPMYTPKAIAGKQAQKSVNITVKTSSKSRASKARRDNILEFITKRGSASAGDLSSVITNCSSKTLQRDLLYMVANDILSKEGNKRWTRYSLA